MKQSAVFGAARIVKVPLKFLGILGNWRESLTYDTGLVKHSDHRSPRDFLNFNDSIATFEIESMFNIILGGREEKGNTKKVLKLK